MLRRGLVAGLLVALLGGAAPAPAVAPVPSPAPTPWPSPARIARWEYKTITYNRVAMFGDSEAELRLLGLQGWELVSAVFDPNARNIVLFLKRPVGP